MMNKRFIVRCQFLIGDDFEDHYHFDIEGEIENNGEFKSSDDVLEILLKNGLTVEVQDYNETSKIFCGEDVSFKMIKNHE